MTTTDAPPRIGAGQPVAAAVPGTRGRALWLPGFVVFVGALVFYVWTLAPSTTWGDGARLQMDAALGGSTYLYIDELGDLPGDGWPFDRLGVVAWDHPLHVMLAHAFTRLPVGDISWRVNLLSALTGALALALVLGLAITVVGDRRAALLAAVALAVSHTFWFLSVTAEVYTLLLVFAVPLVWLAVDALRRRRLDRLPLFALLAGLGLATHIMLVLTLAPIVLCLAAAMVRDRRSTAGGEGDWPTLPRRTLALALVLFVVGWAPWWIQVGRMAHVAGLELTLRLASGLPWLSQRATLPPAGTLVGDVAGYAGFLLYQFTPLGVGLAVAGLLCLWRRARREAVLLGTLFLANAAFSITYRVPDRFTFHVTSYMVFALLIAGGLAWLLAAADRRPGWARAAVVLLAVGLLAPVVIYRASPGVVRATGRTAEDLGIPDVGDGARDGLAYFLDPNQRGDDAARRYGQATLSRLEPEAMVLAPWPDDQETWVVLRYTQRVEGVRPDVRLDLLLFEPGETPAERVLSRARSLAACYPVYLASPTWLEAGTDVARRLEAEFVVQAEGGVYQLLPRDPVARPWDCAARLDNWSGVPLGERLRRALP